MSFAILRAVATDLSALMLASLLLTGCMTGTIPTVVGTGVVYEQKQKYEHQHEVERAVDRYIADHADSPCTQGEDRVLEPAVEILKNYRATGYGEVMDRLGAIYQDESQEEGVRAAALYNMAVLNSRKREPNKALAREYFKRLYVEFPNQYRCIFDESEWRDNMIEEQLLTPGETVESFLEDARKDAQRRQAPTE